MTCGASRAKSAGLKRRSRLLVGRLSISVALLVRASILNSHPPPHLASSDEVLCAQVDRPNNCDVVVSFREPPRGYRRRDAVSQSENPHAPSYDDGTRCFRW